MTVASLARALMRLITLAVLAFSGGYLIVYLYRWEWNRAIISGVIFVAAELALLGSIVTRRLAVIERRLAAHAIDTPVRADSGSGPGPASSPASQAAFRWLDPSRTAVFIPVLMGAGAILSAVAYLVERVARYFVAEGGPRRSNLQAFAYPGTEPPSPPEHRSAGSVVSTVVALGAAGLLGAVGINVVAEVTQSRPEPDDPSRSTELVIEIGYRRGDDRSALETANALLETCRTQLPESPTISEAVVVAPRRVRTTITPALGELRVRRLRGCIEDATIDRVKAYVRSVETVLL